MRKLLRFKSLGYTLTKFILLDMISEMRRHLFVLCLLMGSLFLSLASQDFPLTYHADESKKVRFIENGHQDFFHPILLLQLARAVNIFTQFHDPQLIVQLGRTLSAFAQVGIVFIALLLGEHLLQNHRKWLLAALSATSPLLVIHAHYFKEDMVFAFFFFLSLYLIIKEKEFWKIGLAVGATMASKYVGILLLPLALFYCKEARFKTVCLAFFTFIIVNYPLIFDFGHFLNGLSFEIHHMTEGHGLPINPDLKKVIISITPLQTLFSFHLMNSLLPGLTLPVLLLALIGIVIALSSWKKIRKEERFFLLVLFIYYLITECSPAKVFPDFMRYMAPITVLLLYFAVRPWPVARKMHSALACCALAYTLYDTSMLLYYLNQDTRAEALALVQGHNVKGEDYTPFKGASIAFLDLDKERSSGVEYFLASSFHYDRVFVAHQLDNCPELIKKMHDQYLTLFSYPSVEIKPKYRSFAFSNPLIRIINIQGNNETEPCTETH